MIGKAVEVIEIDTKEICLLCYDRCVKGDGEEIIKRASSLTGLKQLLRYLKVNIKQLFNCSPGFLQWMEIKHEIDVQITLCHNCSLMTGEFDKLYKEYELIKFQFDKCLTILHQSMKSGADNPDRVREFKKQMQPNKSFDIVNASIAVNFRDQTFKKCSLKLENSLPRVTVQKVKQDVHRNLINHTSINFNKPSDLNLNNSDKIETFSAMVQGLYVINDNSNQDNIDEGETPCDPSFEVPQNDPLEPDITDVFDDENEDDAPSIHFSPSNSPTSSFTPSPARDSLTTCDFCNTKQCFHSHDLRHHQYTVHPEHIICKHYSSTSELPLSLFECKQLAAKFFEHAFANSGKSGTKKIHCCYCDKSLSSMLNLKAHLVKFHMERVAEFASEHCPVTYNIMEPDNKEKCDQCSKAFASEARLRKHKLSHSKMYSCRYCSYTHGYLNRIKSHELDTHTVEVLTPHMAPVTCQIKIARGVKALYKKMSTNETNCLICASHMANKGALKRHILARHFTHFLKQLKDYLDQGQFSYDVNDRNTSEDKDGNPSSEYCEFCSFTSKDQSEIRLHELEFHLMELVMQYLPPDTSRRKCYQGVEAYQKKLKTMGTQCHICISAFKTNSDLQRHILSCHFDEIVKELKDYLEGRQRDLGGLLGEGEERPRVEIVPPPADVQLMEFETDDVKLEVDAVVGSAGLFDPSNMDYLD